MALIFSKVIFSSSMNDFQLFYKIIPGRLKADRQPFGNSVSADYSGRNSIISPPAGNRFIC